MLKCIIACLLISVSLFAKDETITYFEKDGVVAVEIESYKAAGDWKEETNLTGFSGKSYYTWKGGDRFNSPGSGELKYKFKITKPGKYLLVLHNRHDFKDSTEENDCFTKLNDGQWVKTFSSERGKWTWHTKHEWSHNKKHDAFYELTTGIHTFSISGRSKGFSIDRFHICHESAFKKAKSLSVKISTDSFLAIPKSVTDRKILAYWKNKKMGMVIRECKVRLSKGEDKVASELLAFLDRFVKKRKSEIKLLQKSSPSATYNGLNALASTFRYTDYEKEIRKEMYQLTKDRSFQNAIQAEKAYIKACEMLKKRRGRQKEVSPSTLRSVAKIAAELKRRYPDLSYSQQLEQKIKDLKKS